MTQFIMDITTAYESFDIYLQNLKQVLHKGKLVLLEDLGERLSEHSLGSLSLLLDFPSNLLQLLLLLVVLLLQGDELAVVGLELRVESLDEVVILLLELRLDVLLVVEEDPLFGLCDLLADETSHC